MDDEQVLLMKIIAEMKTYKDSRFRGNDVRRREKRKKSGAPQLVAFPMVCRAALFQSQDIKCHPHENGDQLFVNSRGMTLTNWGGGRESLFFVDQKK